MGVLYQREVQSSIRQPATLGSGGCSIAGSPCKKQNFYDMRSISFCIGMSFV
jgi:hypothetical protein